MTWLRLALVWLLALVGAAEAHEITFTVVNLRLERDETRISVELPIKALLHEQPSPLPAGTTEQTFHAGQLPADLRTSLISLLSARLRVASGGKILPVTVGGIEPTGVYVVLTAAAPAITGVLDIRANLFPDDALHKVFFDVYRSGTLAGQYVLDRQDPAFTLAAPERALREVIGTFVREGIRHIFIGPDHILFVLALILLGGRLWSQIKVVTAFTVAHSTSLALATLGIVRFPSSLVESAIALSIVVVGLHDLRQLWDGWPKRVQQSQRILFAFVFGLVHGLDFGSVLAEFDLTREALVWSLASFNVGVEIGQVTIVLLAAPLLVALRRNVATQVARDLLSAAACVVVLIGGFWVWQRLHGA